MLNAFRHHGCREIPSVFRSSVVYQCSTPFGITAVGSPCGRVRKPTARCAQRLSASRLSGACRAPRGRRACSVLNAFRHHGCREQRSPSCAPTIRSAQRLSASRLSGVPGGVSAADLDACSTPFGITAVGSVIRRDLLTPLVRCSTPFGITAVGRGVGAVRILYVPGAQRLSASRLSGGRPPSPSPQADSAQRLSASRLSGAASCPRTSARWSAQRLSASRLSGVPRSRRRGICVGVLNAFRHHGCREHGHTERGGDRGGVLNAFRHHGCREGRESTAGTTATSCSTPFGITAVGRWSRQNCTPCVTCAQRLSASRLSGGGASREPQRLAGAQRLSASRLSGVREVGRERTGGGVLNAFRHHGCRESPPPGAHTHDPRCSTPFGITAVGSVDMGRRARPRACAQRLSASRLSGE